MRIGFNAQRLAGQRLGVGRYIEYMVRHWSTMLTADDMLSLFVRRPLDWQPTSPRGQIRTVLLESRMSGIPWENLRLRGAIAHEDVLFCPAYTSPVGMRGKTVVATHSVTEVQPGVNSWAYRQTYSRIVAHCARQATAVIVPSAITKESVVDYYGVERERVVVIPQGADDAFQPGTSAELLRATRTQFFGADRPYILFVGKCSARRNIPQLITAFARLKQSAHIPHGLLLFGPNHLDLPLAELCRTLGVEGDVVQTDGVVAHHTDLVPVYSAADVFVHPSEYEGWSMTTVEAMACGVPVIATDRGGLGEVARGHALMVSDPSVDALADAIGRVLSDSALHADLAARARARGMALNWRTITRDTLQVVRNVGSGTSLTDGLSS
jgi:glycosyltransferase involved in cell wall biosynthesis